MRKSTLQSRIVLIGLVSGLSVTGIARDIAVPCWRGQPASTFQEWRFDSAANPADPEAFTNAFGTPRATIVVGAFGSGWLSVLGFGSQTGYWDLGRNGTITLDFPDRSSAPDSAYKYIWVQVTQWHDGGIFGELAAVSIPGATFVDSQIIEVEAASLGAWVLHQSVWRLEPCLATETLLLTGPSNGSIIDAIVVDTWCADLACPADIWVRADSGQCSKAGVTFALPLVDGCSVAAITCTPSNGSDFPVGTTPVNCVISDAFGKIVDCTFNVTVAEDQPPVFLDCPGNLSGFTDPGLCTAVMTYAPRATDNCDPGATVVCAPPSGYAYPVGTTHVVCVAQDAAGNQSTCAFAVSVGDSEPPVLIGCPADTIEATGLHQCGKVVSWPAPIVFDNCASSVAVSCSPASGSFFPTGTTSVICTAQDSAGNSVQCRFTVTVVDTEPPIVQCPGDVTVTALNAKGVIVHYPAPVASDNCPGANYTCTPLSGTRFPVGSTIVACTVTDASANKSQCSFRVIVQQKGGKKPRSDLTDLLPEPSS